MKLNPLYEVLNRLLLAKNSESFKLRLLNQITPILDSTLAGEEYYRIELPPIEIMSNDFKLHEAHVSLFERVDYSCPTLGPSHFTAIFLDSSGQLFRMPLFLNQFDKLACPPSWEKKLKDGCNYVKVEPPVTVEYLSQCIWEQALPYLQELRKVQKEMEVKLSEEFEDLEKKAALLSIHLEANKDSYLARCEALIKTASVLTVISASPYWPRMVTYFSKLHTLVSSMPQSSDESIEVKGKSQARTVKSTKSNQIQSNSIHIEQSLFSKPNKANTLFIKTNNEIHGMNALLDKLSKCQDALIKALYLNDLNHQLIGIDLEKNDSLTCMQLQTLSTIERKVANQATSILETALLTENYELARLLPSFYNLVRGDILLAFALVQKKAKLLEFLFETLGLPLNSYPITIKQKTYANAALYCFLESQTHHLLVDCFSVLVKHGADLMQPIGANKLPMAHLLLSTEPTHPLLQSLENNRKLTLDNKVFYNELIKLLNTCLVSYNYEKHQSDEIKTWVLNYTKIEASADLFNEFVPKLQVLSAEVSEMCKKVLSKAMIKALQEDDDISDEVLKLQRETKTYIKNTKTFHKKTGMRLAIQSTITDSTEDYKQELIKANLSIDMHFSVLKILILQSLSNQRLLIKRSEELLIVQMTIHQTPLRSGQKNKKLKQLCAQEQQLLKEVDELSKRMPNAMLKKYNEQQEMLKKLMGQNFDSIESLDQLRGLTKVFESLNFDFGFENHSEEEKVFSFGLG